MNPDQTNSTNSAPPPIPPTPPAPPPVHTTPVTIPTSSVPPPPSKNWLPWVIAAAVIGFLAIVAIGISVGISIIQSMFRYTPPPAPPPPPPEVTVKPISPKYASDSAIMDLRDRLKKISQSVDSVDLIEPQISPPALDLDINIKSQ